MDDQLYAEEISIFNEEDNGNICDEEFFGENSLEILYQDIQFADPNEHFEPKIEKINCDKSLCFYNKIYCFLDVSKNVMDKENNKRKCTKLMEKFSEVFGYLANYFEFKQTSVKFMSFSSFLNCHNYILKDTTTDELFKLAMTLPDYVSFRNRNEKKRMEYIFEFLRNMNLEHKCLCIIAYDTTDSENCDYNKIFTSLTLLIKSFNAYKFNFIVITTGIYYSKIIDIFHHLQTNFKLHYHHINADRNYYVQLDNFIPRINKWKAYSHNFIEYDMSFFNDKLDLCFKLEMPIMIDSNQLIFPIKTNGFIKMFLFVMKHISDSEELTPDIQQMLENAQYNSNFKYNDDIEIVLWNNIIYDDKFGVVDRKFYIITKNTKYYVSDLTHNGNLIFFELIK